MGQPLIDLATLNAQWRLCTRCCRLPCSVPGRGKLKDPFALVVGQYPGIGENIPYTNRPGQFVLECFAKYGLNEQNTYFTNVIKCHPDSLLPTADSVKQCREYLDEEIRVLQPKLLVGMGNWARTRLLKKSGSLTAARGQIHKAKVGKDEFPCIIVTHPAALLNCPEHSERWESTRLALAQDFRFLGDYLVQQHIFVPAYRDLDAKPGGPADHPGESSP